jgi:hypothetical protein
MVEQSLPLLGVGSKDAIGRHKRLNIDWLGADGACVPSVALTSHFLTFLRPREQ